MLQTSIDAVDIIRPNDAGGKNESQADKENPQSQTDSEAQTRAKEQENSRVRFDKEKSWFLAKDGPLQNLFGKKERFSSLTTADNQAQPIVDIAVLPKVTGVTEIDSAVPALHAAIDGVKKELQEFTKQREELDKDDSLKIAEQNFKESSVKKNLLQREYEAATDGSRGKRRALSDLKAAEANEITAEKALKEAQLKHDTTSEAINAAQETLNKLAAEAAKQYTDYLVAKLQNSKPLSKAEYQWMIDNVQFDFPPKDVIGKEKKPLRDYLPENPMSDLVMVSEHFLGTEQDTAAGSHTPLVGAIRPGETPEAYKARLNTVQKAGVNLALMPSLTHEAGPAMKSSAIEMLSNFSGVDPTKLEAALKFENLEPGKDPNSLFTTSEDLDTMLETFQLFLKKQEGDAKNDIFKHWYEKIGTWRWKTLEALKDKIKEADARLALAQEAHFKDRDNISKREAYENAQIERGKLLTLETRLTRAESLPHEAQALFKVIKSLYLEVHTTADPELISLWYSFIGHPGAADFSFSTFQQKATTGEKTLSDTLLELQKNHPHLGKMDKVGQAAYKGAQYALIITVVMIAMQMQGALAGADETSHQR